MSTKKLVNGLLKLQAELAKGDPNERWMAARACLAVVIDFYKGQLHYERAKEMNPDTYLDFFEPFTPLNSSDREQLKKAIALNRELGKTLGKMKKAKDKTKVKAGSVKTKGKASKRST